MLKNGNLKFVSLIVGILITMAGFWFTLTANVNAQTNRDIDYAIKEHIVTYETKQLEKIDEIFKENKDLFEEMKIELNTIKINLKNSMENQNPPVKWIE